MNNQRNETQTLMITFIVIWILVTRETRYKSSQVLMKNNIIRVTQSVICLTNLVHNLCPTSTCTKIQRKRSKQMRNLQTGSDSRNSRNLFKPFQIIISQSKTEIQIEKRKILRKIEEEEFVEDVRPFFELLHSTKQAR